MLWDVGDPRNPTTIATLSTPDQTIISMAFSSDGATLAASADNHTISMWNTLGPAAPAQLATLTGLTNPSDVVFEPASHTAISAAADGTPVFWDLSYDFPGATVYPAGTLTSAQIRDADWKTAPPEVRTTLGETLFIPRKQQGDLEQFCRRNDITKKHRPDTWSDLLEPFLDTWFDPEDELATDNRLREAGLSEEEVAGIRQLLAPLMQAYDFDSMLWEWVNLGLFDLLNAATGPLVKPSLQATLGDPTTLYTWAMQIAERHR